MIFLDESATIIPLSHIYIFFVYKQYKVMHMQMQKSLNVLQIYVLY